MKTVTKFHCKFENQLEGQYGSPKYIRGSGFDAIKLFHRFEVMDTIVTREDQTGYLNSALTEDGGWISFVCGSPENCRMFAYSLMTHYASESNKLLWHRVNSSRYDILLDERFRKQHHMIVLDCLLTHPKMHPNASRAYDPARLGKIHDIVGEYRGESSIVILCPELQPEEAYYTSMIQADLMWLLKPRVKDVEL